MQGAREINLVAQDLAHYGRDLRDGSACPSCSTRWCARRRFPGSGCCICTRPASRRRCWRLLRASHGSFRTSTCRCSTHPTPCSRACGAPSASGRFASSVGRFREAVPDVAIRTTCIVGFPGETDAGFRARCSDFLEEIRFDRVGAFTYSPQEGTRAAEMADDVPERNQARAARAAHRAAASDQRREERRENRAARDRARGSRGRLEGDFTRAAAVAGRRRGRRHLDRLLAAAGLVRGGGDHRSAGRLRLRRNGRARCRGSRRGARRPAREALPLAAAGSHSFGR